MRHIVYVQTMVRLRNGDLRALVMLTTTSPRMIDAIPPGLGISISPDASSRLGMRSGFTIDVHRLALLPPEPEWFPDIERDGFIVAHADPHLRDSITRRYDEMKRRFPNPALLLGPAM
ncbi:MAG: hypothetical protein HQL38_15290 [Alphaproteobacteria bacterium]|nr:hypothetical protein [Alphaproteobacteria bacterium]